VYEGRTGRGLKIEKPALAILKLVSEQGAEETLVGHLNDSDSRVVAYCIIGLELLNNSALSTVAERLINRRDKVRILAGRTLDELELYSVALYAQSAHREGRSLDRWLSYGHSVSETNLSETLRKIREL
jgi:hypothetical protein